MRIVAHGESKGSVDHVMEDVDPVFHAAVLKEVPSREFLPIQAVLTYTSIGSRRVTVDE